MFHLKARLVQQGVALLKLGRAQAGNGGRNFKHFDKGALNAALRIFLRAVQQSLQAHCLGAANADPASLHLATCRT